MGKGFWKGKIMNRPKEAKRFIKHAMRVIMEGLYTGPKYKVSLDDRYATTVYVDRLYKDGTVKEVLGFVLFRKK